MIYKIHRDSNKSLFEHHKEHYVLKLNGRKKTDQLTGYKPVLSQGSDAVSIKISTIILTKVTKIIIAPFSIDIVKYIDSLSYQNVFSCNTSGKNNNKAKSEKVCEILIQILTCVEDSHQNCLFSNKM